jgi:hypothetical protein
MELKTGTGLTVNITSCVFTAPLPDVSVNMYLTFTGNDVVLVSISLITASEPDVSGSLIPATAARIHVNVTSGFELEAVYVNALPEHIGAGDSVELNTGKLSDNASLIADNLPEIINKHAKKIQNLLAE